MSAQRGPGKRVLITYSDARGLAREVDARVGAPLEWITPDQAGAESADVWFCASRPPERPLSLPALRWIQSGWAGIEAWRGRPEWRDGVTLTRTVGDFPTRLAEYVFGYLLARELDVPEALRQMRERAWKRWTPGTLAGRSLLVVGYGAIGRQIAAVGRAMGMHVSGIRRDPARGGTSEEGVRGPEGLADYLRAADVVVNVLPHTPETESFWNRERFSAMREGTTFVNVSRGTTVDEAALLEALAMGRPRFAILDVFREEPLPADHPLRALDSVWTTPHVAGIGTSAPLAAEFAENWRRFQEGLPLRHAVDRARGY